MIRIITKEEYEFLSKKLYFKFDGVKCSITTALSELYPEGVSRDIFINRHYAFADDLPCTVWISKENLC